MIDDDRLADVLASIGPRLVLEPSPAPATSNPAAQPVAARRGWTRRRWLVAGLAAAALGTAASPLPTAVADRLGIGSTRIDVRPESALVPAELPAIGAGATPISARRATTLLGSAVTRRLDDSALGAPAGFATIPEGGVLVAWPDGTTLWVHGAPIPAGGWLEKLIASDLQVQSVDDLGDAALAVVGDHVLQTPQRTLAAGTTLLWTRGATEFRLAGSRPLTDLVAAARVLDGG